MGTAAGRETEKDIVYYYAKIFEILKWVSVFEVVRCFVKKRYDYSVSPRFVEFWVFGHLVLSCMAVVLAYFFGNIKG